MDSGGKISCASGSGVIINVRTNFTFRGTIVETGSNARPKLFVGVFGTNSIPIEGPFTGTLMALTAPITLATVNPPAVHTGAFYARDITVNPNMTITHFPFFGPTHNQRSIPRAAKRRGYRVGHQWPCKRYKQFAHEIRLAGSP